VEDDEGGADFGLVGPAARRGHGETSGKGARGRGSAEGKKQTAKRDQVKPVTSAVTAGPRGQTCKRAHSTREHTAITTPGSAQHTTASPPVPCRCHAAQRHKKLATPSTRAGSAAGATRCPGAPARRSAPAPATR